MDSEQRSSPFSGDGGNKYAGTALYDSYELREINRQLSKVLGRDGMYAPSSPYMRHLSSPAHNRCLHRIYKENAVSPKKISRNGLPRERKVAGDRPGDADRGFLAQLWRKLRRGLLMNRRRGCGSNTNDPR
ncbi:hypothetical protein MLD38_031893 [Melastoma candidum]|uniref:Uncharacterized protein n=1 Tax=Melastoma candidum TaxID=119954 RepID=A0ACB9MUC1_9MYRT|nr:hypothetical protein MLD38_031893 [Melastoma candidum]